MKWQGPSLREWILNLIHIHTWFCEGQNLGDKKYILYYDKTFTWEGDIRG